METRNCPRCGRTFPATTEWFYRDKNRKSGLTPRCKECLRDYSRDYSRQYRKANREKVNEYSRSYYKANAQKWRQFNRYYYARNPEKRQVVIQRHNTRKRALPTTYTADNWKAALDYFEGKCAVCGRPAGLFHTLSMDHWISVSSPECPGTVVTNIVPLCHGIGGCNNSKGNRPAHDWLVDRFGARKARDIEAQIAAFFQHMRERFAEVVV